MSKKDINLNLKLEKSYDNKPNNLSNKYMSSFRSSANDALSMYISHIEGSTLAYVKIKI